NFVASDEVHRHLDDQIHHANRIILENHIVSVAQGNHALETSVFDFIGPEIDIGFRISHFAQRGFLLVSAALAYVVRQESGAAEEPPAHLKSAPYEKHRGVGGGRVSPIVWSSEGGANPRTFFSSADRFETPLIGRICRGEHEPVSAVPTILE